METIVAQIAVARADTRKLEIPSMVFYYLVDVLGHRGSKITWVHSR